MEQIMIKVCKLGSSAYIICNETAFERFDWTPIHTADTFINVSCLSFLEFSFSPMDLKIFYPQLLKKLFPVYVTFPLVCVPVCMPVCVGAVGVFTGGYPGSKVLFDNVLMLGHSSHLRAPIKTSRTNNHTRTHTHSRYAPPIHTHTHTHTHTRMHTHKHTPTHARTHTHGKHARTVHWNETGSFFFQVHSVSRCCNVVKSMQTHAVNPIGNGHTSMLVNIYCFSWNCHGVRFADSGPQ